jgi:hypothetical protein
VALPTPALNSTAFTHTLAHSSTAAAATVARDNDARTRLQNLLQEHLRRPVTDQAIHEETQRRSRLQALHSKLAPAQGPSEPRHRRDAPSDIDKCGSRVHDEAARHNIQSSRHHFVGHSALFDIIWLGQPREVSPHARSDYIAAAGRRLA